MSAAQQYTLVALSVLFLLPGFSSCSEPDAESEAPVWVDQTLTPADRINWPGIDRADGRVIPFIDGFGNGRASGYWFLGFAAERSADAFLFCREGDDNCPLDSHRRLNWDRLVGDPLFARIPGDPLYSYFWQIWTVVVPDDFPVDSVPTIGTLFRLVGEGRVRVEREQVDFGGEIGIRDAIFHCALVLRGTELENNGGLMPDGSGPMTKIPRHTGFRQRLRVEFFDFSQSEGVFPAADDSAERPLMPFANIYIFWRDCSSDPRPAICDVPSLALEERRAVSERGLGQDITGDGDANDTNNVVGSLPCEAPDPDEPAYSPLWAVQTVNVIDSEGVSLIDTFGDQTQSDIQSTQSMRSAIEADFLEEPVPQTTDSSGVAIDGVEEQLFFNCPSPVALGAVPYPCEGQ